MDEDEGISKDVAISRSGRRTFNKAKDFYEFGWTRLSNQKYFIPNVIKVVKELRLQLLDWLNWLKNCNHNVRSDLTD